MDKPSLTPEERRIVKALLGKGRKNQDILTLVNTNRKVSVNGGRITGVKKDGNQAAATDDELAMFQLRKISYDPKTGLNQFDDERLVRAREAMILAVQVFNSPSLKFKTEVFSVLANIAWTYLLHEYYLRKGEKIVDDQGRSHVLGYMIAKQDCPLSEGVRDNLRSMKELRDSVEHVLLGPADARWFSLFQACCLNFDRAITQLFGDRLSLSNDLSFALQFAKPNIGHLASLMNYPVPAAVEAIDARLSVGMTEERISSLEYKFRVIYAMDAGQGIPSHFKFVAPGTDESTEINNVLAKRVPADHLYPHRAGAVVAAVRARTGDVFNSAHHTKAWKLWRVRPPTRDRNPEATDRRYSIYHSAHKDYTYSDAWIERLVDEVSDPAKFQQIKNAPP
ncbi:DUF3644 domain-containing protein [Paracoccus yeei]|uniref:DUF3644 domain-containing protein n=1 Tax=Paracoccus yeei TaxID=147645 RepID=UPI0037D25A5F